MELIKIRVCNLIEFWFWKQPERVFSIMAAGGRLGIQNRQGQGRRSSLSISISTFSSRLRFDKEGWTMWEGWRLLIEPLALLPQPTFIHFIAFTISNLSSKGVQAAHVDWGLGVRVGFGLFFPPFIFMTAF